jgi:serine protease Do
MRAQLLHLSGPMRGRTTTYPDPVVRIGSEAGSEVQLDDPLVAGKHARIDWIQDECRFHFRAKDGAVFVNGNQVEEVILRDGDQLEFGIGGPRARFRIYVPIGAVCKPVRRMLSDAAEVARHSGRRTATRMLTKDLLTQATPRLKVGVPVTVLAAAFLVSWLGGWLGSQQSIRQDPGTVNTALKQEVDEMRLKDVIRRVQKDWARGVCLIHGIYKMRDPSGSWVLGRSGDALEVEYTGSGFLVSEDGHVVTNRHVALPWTSDMRHNDLVENGATPVFTHLTATFPGRMPVAVSQENIARRDDDLDVAVLRLGAVEVEGIPVLPLREDGTEGEDQRAIVVGYPTGLSALLARADKSTIADLRANAASMSDAIITLAKAGQIKPVITQGVVSNSEDHLIAYDASTTSGGSGGPVFSGKGDVIAVNFAIQHKFAGNNLGVPIRFVRELLSK